MQNCDNSIETIEPCLSANSSTQSKGSSSGWWQSAANWMKKTYFNGAHRLDLAFNNEKSNRIWLYGHQYDSNENIRFSIEEGNDYGGGNDFNRKSTTKSDVGWGCMIRVGQMMMAHCLRVNKGIKYFHDPQELESILGNFIYKDGMFSIEKIAQKAYKMLNLYPGEWYSPSDIAHVLKEIQNSTVNVHSNLKVLVYDNEFQLSKTLNFLNAENHRKSNLSLRSNPKITMGTLNNQEGGKGDGGSSGVQNVSVNRDLKIDPGLIIILMRIGYKTAEKELLETVVRILKEESNCIGILGGRAGKAHYLVGTTESSFIYLDPHCVKGDEELFEKRGDVEKKSAEDKKTDGRPNKEVKEKGPRPRIESFFCSENMFSVAHEKIDPSMGLCFYVRDTAELILLYERFSTKYSKQSLPFYNYSKCEIPLIAEKYEDTETFELVLPPEDESQQ